MAFPDPARSDTAHGSSAPPRRLRPGAIRVGRLAGVPIYLTLSWLVLAVLVVGGYGRLAGREGASATVNALLGVVVVVCLLVSVLLHELAHALVARWHAVGVRGITLELLGGYTEMESEAPRPGPEALIALAGPVTSLLLGGVGAALAPFTPRGSVVGDFVFLLAASNLIVGVFNLLPGLPLDGGRALRAGIWRLSGDPRRADLVAGWCGRVIALATVASALVLRFNAGALSWFSVVFMALIGGTLWAGATDAIRLGRLRQKLPALNAGGLARPLHVVVSGTPLSEALRQREELDRDPSLGVANSSGQLIGLVSPVLVAGVPVERRPWTEVDAVAAPVGAQQRIGAEASGMAVLDAVSANPGADLLVTVGEDVIGVLSVADVMARLEVKEKR
jgi:Zn-dependent protease